MQSIAKKGGIVVKNLPANAGGKKKKKKCRFNPQVGKILWRRKWQPTSVFLPRKFHGQKMASLIQ